MTQVITLPAAAESPLFQALQGIMAGITNYQDYGKQFAKEQREKELKEQWEKIRNAALGGNNMAVPLGLSRAPASGMAPLDMNQFLSMLKLTQPYQSNFLK